MTDLTMNSLPLMPVSFNRVRIDDVFWGPRQRTNREVTLPIEYRQCLDTGRIEAFRLDWQPGKGEEPHIFWDSDVAKWVEAAAYSLITHADPALEAQLDEVIALIVSAQQPDGYLNVHYTVVEPEKRWSNLRDCHELYCAGHLIEAGVAHYQATGKRTLLDAMCRYADYIGTVFGTASGQKRGYCGHEELELALVKLAQATGEPKYLAQAGYFVDERGRQPYYFDVEAVARGEEPAGYWAKSYAYCQADRPVRDLAVVEGHAVRAMYLYSAMADLAGLHGDAALRAACERLWNDLCLKKLYLTGGIGPSRHNEGFTQDYDLPNESAYAETCAAIGLVFWSHRLLQLECDGRYADVMERALYNGALSGVSLDGAAFFYENPLASHGHHHRQAWFGCACCPPNLARLLASLGQYIASTSADSVALHLYIQGALETTLPDGSAATIAQTTRYPWDGHVAITLQLTAPSAFTLRLRIPGWCRRHTLAVNGQPVEAAYARGYAAIARSWQPGDVITLMLEMPVEIVAAHPGVTANLGRVALQRGPLVYCLEDVDHTAPVLRLLLRDGAPLVPRWDPELLGGVVVIEGEGLLSPEEGWGDTLYQPYSAARYQSIPVRAIPYYAWDNRAPGGMVTWVPIQS